MIADVLQDDPLLGPFLGKFDQRLEQLEEQGVLAKPSGVEVLTRQGR